MAPSCGIQGDVFQLIREKLGVGFNEAVLYVSAYHNITPPEFVKPSKSSGTTTTAVTPKDTSQRVPVKEKVKPEKEKGEIKRVGLDYIPEEIARLKEQPNYAKFCQEAHLKFLESKEAQDYIQSRGISIETAKKCILGFSNEQIVVPYIINGKIVYYSARSIKNKSFYQPTGSVPCPIGLDTLKSSRIIYIAEGLFDYLTLVEKGFSAIGVPGANAWKHSREWNSLLLGHKVMLCFHADEDGIKTNSTLEVICQGLSIPYEVVDWSVSSDITVKDINDYTQKGGDIRSLFHNETDYELSDVKESLSKLVDLSDYPDAPDLAIALVIANVMQGDPVWILLVGPPSVGKTEIIRSVNNAVSTYFINRISPNTLISGFTKVEYADVITRIVKPTTFCITDFGSFLSFHPQDMQKIMQQLRDVYDGKVHVEYGNGKIVDWTGKVGIIGGITPEIERHTAFIGRLGDRFLYYRMGISEGKRIKIAMDAILYTTKEEDLRKRIRIVTSKFIDRMVLNLKKADEVEIDYSQARKIAAAADFLARTRTPVARMHDMEKTIEYRPEYEATGRISRAFKVLIKSLAFIRGKGKVTEDEYRIIKDICHGSIPSIRLQFMEAAYTHQNEWLSSAQFGEKLGKDTGSARYHLNNLLAIGLIDRESTGRDHKWMIKKDAVSLIEEAEFFEN